MLACLCYKVSSAYHNIISTNIITLCIRKFDNMYPPDKLYEYAPFGPGQTQMLEENSFFEGHKKATPTHRHSDSVSEKQEILHFASLNAHLSLNCPHIHG